MRRVEVSYEERYLKNRCLHVCSLAYFVCFAKCSQAVKYTAWENDASVCKGRMRLKIHVRLTKNVSLHIRLTSGELGMFARWHTLYASQNAVRQ